MWYYRVNEKRNPIYKTDARFQEHKQPIKYLFLGHSRVYGGVNDSVIPGSFTFATNSEPNIFTYYKLRHILEDTDKQVETVLMPIGLGTFFSVQDPGVYDCAYWKRYVDFVELGGEMNERSKYITAYVRSSAFPYARQITQLINRKLWNKNKRRPKLADFTTHAEKVGFARSSILFNSTVRTPYDDVSMTYFNRALALCKEKNVNVILVKYPVSSYYRQAFNELADSLNVDFSRVDSVLTGYPEYQVLDYSELFDNNEEHFVDAHHLSVSGREALSEELRKALAE